MVADAKVNLVIVSHPDDEILGLGGAGARLAAAGETVQPVILCGSVDARTKRPTDDELFADMSEANRRVGFRQPVLGAFPNIRMNTIDHLSLVQFIEAQVLEFQPHRIFTHHPSDLNDDHKQVCRAAMAAGRLFQRRADVRPLEELLLMEVPSATDWSFPGAGDGTFEPNCFVEIGAFLDLKIEALGCYRNVMRPFPHPRSPEALRGLAAVRGAQSGLGYAEAFQTVFRTNLG
jgi:LmbE family N-acetylglucosaminyl deacetylase